MLKNVKFAKERVKLLQKGIIGKRMLKVKATRKGKQNNDDKNSTWNQSFFNSFSSQIKSDDIPSEVKLYDINNIDINPHITLCCCNSCKEILKNPKKRVKMRTQILFKLFHSIFKWGN